VKQNFFDLVILGNEPAGLWLAQQFLKQKTAAQIVWIKFPNSPGSYPILSAIAHPFSLELRDTIPIEFVSPKGSFWSGEKSFLDCFWNSISRSQTANPDFTVPSDSAPQIGFWDLSSHSLTGISQFPCPLGQNNSVFTAKYSKQALSLTSPDGREVSSNKWIINCSLFDWRLFIQSCPAISELFCPEEKQFESSWTVPMELSVPTPFLNQCLKSFSIFLDSEYFPNPRFESWPVESLPRSHETTLLRIWVEFASGTFPTHDHPRFKKGLDLLLKIFPNLQDQTWDFRIGTPAESFEKYHSSLLLPETRYPFLFCLGPYLNCHLPYPQGPLEAAQQLLRKWLPGL